MRLHIDIETYASKSLDSVGLYKYVNDPSFQIMLFGYAVDDKPVAVLDMTNGFKLSRQLLFLLNSPKVTKVAHNASFEIICLSKVLGYELDWSQWECTLLKCMYHGIPGSLKEAGKMLGTKNLKMETRTLNFFCTPHMTFGRRFPFDYPNEWEEFKEYNRIDVEVERDIDNALPEYLIDTEKKLWSDVDRKINDYGIKIDYEFCEACLKNDGEMKKQAESYIMDKTGFKPKSIYLKEYLRKLDYRIINMKATLVDKYLNVTKDTHPAVEDILKHRQIVASTSSAKYSKMIDLSQKGEIKYMLKFYGAGRTGRWSSKGVQLHNFKRTPELPIAELEDIRAKIKEGVPVHLAYGYDIYGKMVRTAIIPKNKVFKMFDFAAIEARVLVWLAKEDWAVDVFRNSGKIYEAQAAKMYGVPIDKVDKGLRRYGKLATLALGYGGGVKALMSQDGNLLSDEAEEIVSKYRSGNLMVVGFWKEVEKRFRQAKKTGITMLCRGGIKIHPYDDYMQIELLSGRRLTYYATRLTYEQKCISDIYLLQGKVRYDRPPRILCGRNPKLETELYGGLLVENIVQATARDILASCLVRLSEYPIAFHVHDEIVFDGDVDETVIKQIMETPPDWCKDLPLKVAAITAPFYVK
jgi:DNA polymerase bacteriophage-type